MLTPLFSRAQKPEIETLVELHNDQAVTTSLILAEAFDKEHKNVLQSLESMECSDEFRRLNFQQSSYINSQNKSQPMHYITRDGFSFLAMGFTGKKAAEFKERFINSFNQLEKRLALPTDNSQIIQLLTTQTQLLTQLVTSLVTPQSHVAQAIESKPDVVVDVRRPMKIGDLVAAWKIPHPYLHRPVNHREAFEALRNAGVFYHHACRIASKLTKYNRVSPDYETTGYFHVKNNKVGAGGHHYMVPTILVTPEGQDFVRETLLKQFKPSA